MNICFHGINSQINRSKYLANCLLNPSLTNNASFCIHFGKTIWKYSRTFDAEFSFYHCKVCSLEKLSFTTVQISHQVTRNQTDFYSASRSSWMPPTAGTQGNTNYIPMAGRAVLLWDCSNFHPMVIIPHFAAGNAGYEKIFLPSSFFLNRSQVTQKLATFQEWTDICSPALMWGLGITPRYENQCLCIACIMPEILLKSKYDSLPQEEAFKATLHSNNPDKEKLLDQSEQGQAGKRPFMISINKAAKKPINIFHRRHVPN